MYTVTRIKFTDIAIPETLYSKIKDLANDAVESYLTKQEAKPYVDQLIFLRYQLPNDPLLRGTFDKLVGSVEAASGQGRDKQHWLMYVSQNLIQLESDFSRINRESVNKEG